ncbi:hypothetical protein LXL04_033476 [Taraxacum kok-saghyz]
MHPVSLYLPQNFKELENPAQSPQNSNCAFSIRSFRYQTIKLHFTSTQSKQTPKKLNSHGRKTRNGAHFDTRNATGLNAGDTHAVRTEVAETALQGRWEFVDGMDTEVSATNNFENKLGKGGFGPVFKVRSFSYTRTETYWTSWLILVFVIVNIAVFVVLMYVNDCPKHNRSRTYGKCVALEKLGALQWQKIVHGNQGWRLVTANWLHAGSILSSLFIQNNISVGAGNMLAFNYHCSFCAGNMLCSRSPRSKGLQERRRTHQMFPAP